MVASDLGIRNQSLVQEFFIGPAFHNEHECDHFAVWLDAATAAHVQTRNVAAFCHR